MPKVLFDMSRKMPFTFFGSSTPRSGGALVSNVLSVHKDILITTDFVHFFRHIYEKYSPISKTSNQFKLVNEMCLRLKYRQRVNVNPKEILSYFENVNNYRDVVDALSNFILSKNPNKKIIGESSNGEWRNIDLFLKLDKDYKSYQVIRDPRAAMTSWKNITFSEGYKYLNIIFNWIDAINYSEKYLEEYNKERYLRIRFEDVHNETAKTVNKLCSFAEVDFDPNMLNAETWPSQLNTEFNYINVSAYNNKKIYGFSKSRTIQWKKNIEEWEIVLIQHLLKDYLKKLNYEILDCDKNLLSKGLKIMENDELLSKNLFHFKKTNEGTDKRLNDPSLPENWAATDLSKDPKARFTDTVDYENYIKEMELIKEKSELLRE